MSDKGKNRAHKILKASFLTVGAFIVLAIAGVCILTCVLTPQRLTPLINREASRILNADVEVKNARFTIWSSFPHFTIEIDSLNVMSRALDNIPDSIRLTLPDNYRFLASTGKFKGGINIMQLLRGDIYLRDIEAESLNLNFVGATDSLANWNIWTSSGATSEVPFITATNLKIVHPGKIKFYSRVTGLNADLTLNELSLLRNKKDIKDYSLAIKGNISAKVNTLPILSGFPFSLSGKLGLHFDPFGIITDNYEVALGNTTGKINMNMQLGKEMKLNNFSYSLDNFNLDKLLEYFPSSIVPRLSGLNADITVNASSRLTAPYVFSSTELPSLEVDFAVPDGELNYTLSNNECYHIRHVGASATLYFNGKDPDSSYFKIPRFRLIGEGGELDMEATVSDLMADPEVLISFWGNANMAKAGELISSLKPFALKGNLTTEATLGFRVSDLQQGNIMNLDLNGKVQLSDYSLTLSGKKIDGKGNRFELDFSGKAGQLDNTDIFNGALDLSATAGKMELISGEYHAVADNLSISSHLSDKGYVKIEDLIESLPFNLNVKAGKVELNNPSDSLDILMKDLNLHGNLKTAPRRLVAKEFDMTLDGRNIKYLHKGDKLDLADTRINLKANALPKPEVAPEFIMPEIWKADSARMKSVRHTSEFLRFDVSERFKDIMKGWHTNAGLNIKNGIFRTSAYPAAVDIAGLDIVASFDSVALRNVELKSGESEVRMKGGIYNLRQFLASKTPAPLKINVDLDIDTIQLNQLAASYEKSKAGIRAGKDNTNVVTSSDSIAWIIPRNLFADIHATARETRYMNLHLYDLNTALSIHDGKADIKDLKISADFGHAYLKFLYDTSNIEKMAMKANLGVMDIDVVGFFQHFHSLLVMMPEMKNLSGKVSAECTGGFYIFPDMYINIPSVYADMHVQGRNLKVHQTKFIRHITRMMLLPDSKDIYISNMNVHGSVHDNLLELYPFSFELSRYRVSMAGLNNFDGKLYYHIGVDKSPVPFPFGINIVGYFSDPKLRFGGSRFKVKETRDITTSVMESNRVNLTRGMKDYSHKLIHAAASSNGK